jgi:hypothetical protein
MRRMVVLLVVALAVLVHAHSRPPNHPKSAQHELGGMLTMIQECRPEDRTHKGQKPSVSTAIFDASAAFGRTIVVLQRQSQERSYACGKCPP